MRPISGIVVDGACSGNPGPGEYRGIDLATGEELFRHKFSKTTNNLMEFFAVVHALKFNMECGNKYPAVYSDSVTAIAWANKGETNTSLVRDASTAVLHTHRDNCVRWLADNEWRENTQLCKWATKNWGEIPADFGNKRQK